MSPCSRPVAALLLSLSTLACTPADPEDEPPIDDEITWRSCGFDPSLSCAGVDVPFDHAAPGEGSFGLRVVRAPARRESRGTIFINFGGPGGTASDILPAVMASPIGQALNDEYDLVSWNPRGTPGSGAFDCADDLPAVFEVDTAPTNLQGVAALREARQTYLDACYATQPELAGHMGWMDWTDDMDAIRAALDLETISYLGFSAGTSLGQVYAHRFPERLDAIVLDSNLSPMGGMDSLVDWQRIGGRVALEDFASWCRASPDDCDLHEDPLARIDDIMAGLAQTPLDVGPIQLTAAYAFYGILASLYSPSGYRGLAGVLSDVEEGDGTGLLVLSHRYFDTNSGDDWGYQQPVFASTMCSAVVSPPTDADVLAAVADGATEGEFLARHMSEIGWCASTPPATRPWTEVPTAPDAPTILLLQSALDVATPLEAAEEVADNLEDAVLVVYEGTGHIATSQSFCMFEHMVDYLTEGILPAEGARCADEVRP